MRRGLGRASEPTMEASLARAEELERKHAEKMRRKEAEQASKAASKAESAMIAKPESPSHRSTRASNRLGDAQIITAYNLRPQQVRVDATFGPGTDHIHTIDGKARRGAKPKKPKKK